MMPWWASMRAWACEPRMSWRKSRRSKSIEALISSMTASGPSAKRPPHMRFFMIGLRESETNDGRTDGKAARRRMLGVAAVAGMLAGAVAVYVKGSANGNGAGGEASGRMRRRRAARRRGWRRWRRARWRPSGRPTSRIWCATSPSRRRTAARPASPPSPARRCWSTCGRPGACPAAPKCRRSTGCRGRSAATRSRWWRSMSTSSNPRARPRLPRRDRRLAPGLLRRPVVRHRQGAEEARPGARPADDHPGRRQGLPHRRHRGAGGMGFGGRQGAGQGGDGARLSGSGDLLLGEGRRPARPDRRRASRPATSTRLRPLDLAR